MLSNSLPRRRRNKLPNPIGIGTRIGCRIGGRLASQSGSLYKYSAAKHAPEIDLQEVTEYQESISTGRRLHRALGRRTRQRAQLVISGISVNNG